MVSAGSVPTTSGEGYHRHVSDHEYKYSFSSMNNCLADVQSDVELGGTMKAIIEVSGRP
jgi:hypothetical protein